MNADQIKQCVATRFKKKLWAVSYEIGLCKHGRLRADIVAVNMGNQINIIEVKSSVADYRSDRKWEQYKQFADRVFFAMHHLVYEKLKSELPKGCGVFVVYDSGLVHLKGRSVNNVIDSDVRLNIMTRMVYRSGDTLHQRKSKTSGAKLVAKTAVEAIQAMPSAERKNRKQNVIDAVEKAIRRYV